MKHTGTVKWFSHIKGYGFVASDNSERDIFIHKTALEKAKINSLKQGDKISFEIKEFKGKFSAENISLIQQ